MVVLLTLCKLRQSYLPKPKLKEWLRVSKKSESRVLFPSYTHDHDHAPSEAGFLFLASEIPCLSREMMTRE
jgi:hypothetical protein